MPNKATLLNNEQELMAVKNQGVRGWKQDLEYLKIQNIPVEDFCGLVIVSRNQSLSQNTPRTSIDH